MMTMRRYYHFEASVHRGNEVYNNTKKSYALMVISSALAGMGNSLEPLSLCVWLHLLCLNLAFDTYFESLILKHLEHDYVRERYNVSANWRILSHELFLFMLCAVICQSIGFCIGFSTIAGYPINSFSTVLLSFIVGISYWSIYVAFVFLPYYFYQKRFSYPLSLSKRGTELYAATERDSILHSSLSGNLPGRVEDDEDAEICDNSRHLCITQFIVVPVLFTATSHLIIGKYFSTFLLVSNAVLDLAPLKSLASLFGLAGITFAVALLTSVVVYSYLNNVRIRRISLSILAATASLLILSSLLDQSSMLYQKDVARFVIKNVHVSCIMGQNIAYNVLQDAANDNNMAFYGTAGSLRHQEHIQDAGSLHATHNYSSKRYRRKSAIASVSDYDNLLATTRERIRKGDTFVLWSETAVSIATNDSEEDFIEEMRILFEQESFSAFLGGEERGEEWRKDTDTHHNRKPSIAPNLDSSMHIQRSVRQIHDTFISEERFLGVTYLKHHSPPEAHHTTSQRFTTNHFVLLTSYYVEKQGSGEANDIQPSFGTETRSRLILQNDSSAVLDRHMLYGKYKAEVVWNYKKAHPVPIIESDVAAGPSELPVYKSKMYGNIGGAICFDMDFPDFIRQAGQKGVDIMLQPSWTWNDIGRRHFEGDALRTLENGFSLFRCSSVGESGIVDPHGVFVSRIYTGKDPSEPFTFMLPLFSRNRTVYNALGYIFEYFIFYAAIIIYLVTFTPEFICVYILECCVDAMACCTKCTKGVAVFLHSLTV